MKLTALVCDNGWTAIYGPDGKHVETYPPDLSEFLVRSLTHPSTQVQLTQINVPVDPNVKDFPGELS